MEKDIEMPVIQPLAIEKQAINIKKPSTIMESNRKWELVYSWHYTLKNGTKVHIPTGFVFDGASIPRAFWSILSPTGIFFIPAILHDYAYKNDFLIYKDLDLYKNKAGKAFWDKMFYEECLRTGNKKLAWIAYRALQVGGWPMWNEFKKEREGKR